MMAVEVKGLRTSCGGVAVVDDLGPCRPPLIVLSAARLVVLPVLSFFSDVIVGGAEWRGNLGALFPLKHPQSGPADTWDPSGPVLACENLAVPVAGAVLAGAGSVRFFGWDSGAAEERR